MCQITSVDLILLRCQLVKDKYYLDSTFKLGEIKFIHIMLHYGLFTWKGNCYCSFTDVFIAVATNIHNKVSFKIECFKNFLSFSPPLRNGFWNS